MELFISADRCSGNGRCYSIAPELVDSDEEGFAFPKGEPIRVSAEDSDLAVRVVHACPERAIVFREAQS